MTHHDPNNDQLGIVTAFFERISLKSGLHAFVAVLLMALLMMGFGCSLWMWGPGTAATVASILVYAGIGIVVAVLSVGMYWAVANPDMLRSEEHVKTQRDQLLRAQGYGSLNMTSMKINENPLLAPVQPSGAEKGEE